MTPLVAIYLTKHYHYIRNKRLHSALLEGLKDGDADVKGFIDIDERGDAESEASIDGGKRDMIGCFYLENCEDGASKKNSGRYM